MDDKVLLYCIILYCIVLHYIALHCSRCVEIPQHNEGSLTYFSLKYTLLSLSGNSGRLTWVRLQQPQKQRYPDLQVHAGSFRVSVIHRTLRWTTGSLTCVSDHLYACVYTRGLGTPTTSQHNIFDSKKTLSQIFLVLLTGPGFSELEDRHGGLVVKASAS